MESKESDKIIKYGKSSLSIEDLDQLKSTALSVGGGTWRTAVAFLKLLAIGAYFIARKRIIEEELLIESNRDHQDRVNDDRDDANTNL